MMEEHKHVHDEGCTCGCHDHHHEHEHHHEHHHDHGDGCDCGCHDHDHEHEHVHGRDVDGIHIEHHIHDEACVVSGVIDMESAYSSVKPVIASKLEELAGVINGMGGIVGHIKASAEIKQTEMFSVTEASAMIKTAPVEEISVRLAAIVFAVTPEQVEPLVETALREIRATK